MGHHLNHATGLPVHPELDALEAVSTILTSCITGTSGRKLAIVVTANKLRLHWIEQQLKNAGVVKFTRKYESLGRYKYLLAATCDKRDALQYLEALTISRRVNEIALRLTVENLRQPLDEYQIELQGIQALSPNVQKLVVLQLKYLCWDNIEITHIDPDVLNVKMTDSPN